MPIRLSRSSITQEKQGSSQKNNRKRKQRDLDAFSIAHKQEPDRAKIRRNRLGQAADDYPRSKRQRILDGDDEDEDESQSKKVKPVESNRDYKNDLDKLDISEGSDSDGNNWRLGHVDDVDDSDVDSDQAFGESDEDKFEGFTFRGSSSGKADRPNAHAKKPRKNGPFSDINLNEAEGEGEGGSEDDLGEDAVDLATMLDNDVDSEGEAFRDQARSKHGDGTNGTSHSGSISIKKVENDDDFASFSDSGEETDEHSIERDNSESGVEDQESTAYTSDAESDDNDHEKLQQLGDFVTSLPRAAPKSGGVDAAANKHEPGSNASFLADLMAVDPALDRAYKRLVASTKSAKTAKTGGIVAVPLPKRQQDALDRKAARQETNKSLDRWQDTVKHNRRAEHLSFPLRDPNAHGPHGEAVLRRIEGDKPRSELEQTIHNILHESGLAGPPGKSETQIMAAEELEAKKMHLDEVIARRAKLRKARELLFREELRSKRIKKIKSKSYRRVHRKDQERAAQKERDLMVAAGLEVSHEEREKNDRRRAEERMGSKHRSSRWAKAVKQNHQTVWDEDARAGMSEMARRNEELRRRVQGKKVHGDNDSGSDTSSDESETEAGQADGEGEQFKLRRQLSKVQPDAVPDRNQSNLASMKFMQRADAARKQRNNEDVERLRRELDGEQSEQHSEPEAITGRRTFGREQLQAPRSTTQVARNELEEGPASEDEVELKEQKHWAEAPSAPALQESQSNVPISKTIRSEKLNTQAHAVAHSSNRPTMESILQKSSTEGDATDKAKQTIASETTAPAGVNGWTVVKYSTPSGKDDAESETEEALAEDCFIPSNLDLVKGAFGGDDVEHEFAQEKAQATKDEDDTITDNTLPGWGSWIGEGISRRQAQRDVKRTKGRFVTKIEGVKAKDRKDAKLEKVIISEKKVKKNLKYLATTLPHPFDSRVTYERQLRMPLGPEWLAKSSFQEGTKPRILVKQGIIAPMEMPML